MTENRSVAEPPRYDQEIDILKGFLTISMILSHAISVLGHLDPNPFASFLNTALKLQTFSGFVFVFGFTTQLSYFSREKLDWRKIIRTILRMVGAFYISAIAAAFWYEKKLTFENIFSILVLNHIPLLSEFIIAFALFLLVALLFMRPIAWLLQRPLYLLLVNVFLLAGTFLPLQDVQSTYLGLFIGTTHFSLYPVLQYFPLFLMGSYFAFKQIKAHPPGPFLGLAGIAVVEWLLSIWGTPSRFPPGLGWILGSIPFVLFWYFSAQYSGKIPYLAPWLARIGTNSLFFLVLSNVFFLALPSDLGQNLLLKYSIITTLTLVVSIYFLTTVIRPARRA